jgi:hypothetical protein
MPNSAAGDLAFAKAAATAIFGSASTENLVSAMETWVANWKAFYTANGIPGLPNSTADQADLAARGAAWGDAVGMALSDDLGPLARIMHHAARFCTLGELARPDVPSGGIGVRQLVMQRVRG